MFTNAEEYKLYDINVLQPAFTPDPNDVTVSCEGMDRCVGTIVYTAGAPATPPTVSFSMDGVNFDLPLPQFIDGGISGTGYTWDIQVNSWKFVRIQVFVPPLAADRVRGSIRLLTKVQN